MKVAILPQQTSNFGQISAKLGGFFFASDVGLQLSIDFFDRAHPDFVVLNPSYQPA